MRWLWPYVRPRLGALAAVLGLAALISLLATAQPYLSKLIIDEGLIGRNFPRLCELCAAIVGLALLGSLLGGFNRWLYVRVSGRILFDLREDVYRHLLRLPPSFFRRRAVGDLVTRLDGDVAEVQRFSTDTLLAFVNALLLLLATAAIMISLSPLLSLVAAAALPLQLALRQFSRAPVQSTTRAVREQSGHITQFLVETLGSAKAVQAAATESYEQRRLHGLNDTFLARLLSQQLVTYGVGAGSALLSHLATAAVFVIGGYRVLRGELTVGTLVAFTAYFTRSSGSALSLMNLLLAYQRAAVSLARVRELLVPALGAGRPGQGPQPQSCADRSEPPARADDLASSGPSTVRTDALTQLPAAPAIEFVGVTYTPADAATPVLRELSWSIEGGAKAVLSGDSGAGKSSLIDLLRRFALPGAGQVRVANQPVEAYALEVLRRAVVVLETEPALFRGSLLHNLRYGHEHASDEAVLEAARRAGVDAFVSQLPAGYATEIGAAGAGLSTGQRQRIAIARALLGHPAVLVLDEATSNLDAAAVAQMHALIDEHFSDATRIIITHVPAQVPRAEALYRLQGGQVQRLDSTLA